MWHLHYLSNTRQNCLWCWRLKTTAHGIGTVKIKSIHNRHKYVIGECPTYTIKSQQAFLTWMLGYIRRTLYRRGRSSYSHHKRWKIHCLWQESLKQFILNEIHHSKTGIFDHQIYNCYTSDLPHLWTYPKLGNMAQMFWPYQLFRSTKNTWSKTCQQ